MHATARQACRVNAPRGRGIIFPEESARARYFPDGSARVRTRREGAEIPVRALARRARESSRSRHIKISSRGARYALSERGISARALAMPRAPCRQTRHSRGLGQARSQKPSVRRADISLIGASASAAKCGQPCPVDASTDSTRRALPSFASPRAKAHCFSEANAGKAPTPAPDTLGEYHRFFLVPLIKMVTVKGDRGVQGESPKDSVTGARGIRERGNSRGRARGRRFSRERAIPR